MHFAFCTSLISHLSIRNTTFFMFLSIRFVFISFSIVVQTNDNCIKSWALHYDLQPLEHVKTFNDMTHFV